ncbi:MAG TPA: hypothetical protein PK668_08265 [Myxococcota bacterium]|nr:hypothetical protein [Myxococcota bacterium]HRY93030.1 hypothetical protein [Myxococcota bacterium]HSA22196.1 hypothetical protein [Myxococcota bacterium]
MTPRRLLSALLLLPLLAGPARAEPPPLVFHGNLVLNDEVYTTVLDLPADAAADRETARLVERRLLRFLLKAGYVLAGVEVEARDGALHVEIDEGKLEKVVFLGAGSLRTLLLKLDLSLPHHVFNRTSLERQLAALGQRHGLPPVTYKLVRTREVAHQGPQLADLGDLQGYPVIPEPGRYELHIVLGKSDWGTGLDADLNYDFPDGLELDLAYRGTGLLAERDRWLLGGALGGDLREKLEDGDPYVGLSHAALELRWFTPPLIGRGFRPFLWLEGDLISRQRADLQLEIFYAARLDATLNVGYELARGLMLSLGGGVEEKFVFGLMRVGADPPPLEDGARLQPFLVGRVDLVFNPREPRRDRRHHLLLEGRHYWVEEQADFGKVAYLYQLVQGLGWHDLVVRSRGTWLYWRGAVPFDEEEPVGGRYVRGVFGGRDYVREVGNLTLEFRLSLVRDLFKLSVFNDLALYGELDRVSADERFMLADSFGLGFHALILDTLQLDLYYAFGLDLEREFDHGLSASLTKAF